MRPFEHLVIEIAGWCNAKCKWCTTGRLNQSHQGISKHEVMTREQFIQVLDYILAQNMITTEAQLELFSWGEPFLNPELDEICLEVSRRKRHYRLSTNGSVLKLLNPKCMEYLDDLRFSVPGFSEQSYGKIHKLCFKQVIKNIAIIAEHFEKNGFPGKLVMNYHVYQHNLDEIKIAQKFCDTHHIKLIPHLAYLADSELLWSYMEGIMDYSILQEVAEELLLFDYKRLCAEMPSDYICRQFSSLVVNEKAQVVPCCFLPNKESIGSVFEQTVDTVREARTHLPQCKRCAENKAMYIVNQDNYFNYGYEVCSDDAVKHVQPRVYYDFGDGYTEVNTVLGAQPQNGQLYMCIRLPEKLSKLRFDPTERCGCILENLKIISDTGPLAIANLNGTVVDDCYFFRTEDPQIEIEVAAQYDTIITITADIKYLS